MPGLFSTAVIEPTFRVERIGSTIDDLRSDQSHRCGAVGKEGAAHSVSTPLTLERVLRSVILPESAGAGRHVVPHSRPQSLNNESSSESDIHNDTRSTSSSSSSLDNSVGSATINGPYRVGNSDGDTCSYHALQEGEACRKPRTCYECLNSDVAGVSDGCLLAPSGFCEDMTSYESNLDYRRNTTGEDLSLTGWYNYFPSVNSSYCEPTDEACVLCDDLVNNDSLSRGIKTENVSTEVARQFCLGTDGCVCVMACETDNWESNMPAECDANGSSSDNGNNASTDATSYSTMLIFYLVLQVALLGVFMYKRGLCRRMATQRPPPRPEGPYNNVNAITSPSNRLRLSGWRKMQNTLIEREKKQRAIQQPQYMSSPRVEAATAQTEDSNTPAQPLSPQVSARNNDTARAAYTQVQDDPGTTASGRERNNSAQEVAASVGSDVVVVEGSYEERITGAGVTRAERASSTVAMLEARRDAV